MHATSCAESQRKRTVWGPCACRQVAPTDLAATSTLRVDLRPCRTRRSSAAARPLRHVATEVADEVEGISTLRRSLGNHFSAVEGVTVAAVQAPVAVLDHRRALGGTLGGVS
jgi:hypothetical protein